jgi:hypothetical protein
MLKNSRFGRVRRKKSARQAEVKPTSEVSVTTQRLRTLPDRPGNKILDVYSSSSEIPEWNPW